LDYAARLAASCPYADLGDEEDPVLALEQAPEARDLRHTLSSGMTAMSTDRLARSLNSSRPPVAVVTDGSGDYGSV